MIWYIIGKDYYLVLKEKTTQESKELLDSSPSSSHLPPHPIVIFHNRDISQTDMQFSKYLTSTTDLQHDVAEISIKLNLNCKLPQLRHQRK